MEHFRITYPAQRSGLFVTQQVVDTRSTPDVWQATLTTARALQLPFGLLLPLPARSEAAPLSFELFRSTQALHALAATAGVAELALALPNDRAAAPSSALESAAQAVGALATTPRERAPGYHPVLDLFNP